MFGFNGMEKDNEVSGLGNSYTAEFWEYDSRLGRRFNVDPLCFVEPRWTPYRAFYCNPVFWIDPNGLLEWSPSCDAQGCVTYTAEEGDNLETLKTQYDLTDQQAAEIFKSNGLSSDKPVKVGTTISGESVKSATGNEVLKFNFKSKQATEQRKLDQLLFSFDYNNAQFNRTKNYQPINLSDYFSGIQPPQASTHVSFSGYKEINGVKVPITVTDFPIGHMLTVSTYPGWIKQV